MSDRQYRISYVLGPGPVSGPQKKTPHNDNNCTTYVLCILYTWKYFRSFFSWYLRVCFLGMYFFFLVGRTRTYLISHHTNPIIWSVTQVRRWGRMKRKLSVQIFTRKFSTQQQSDKYVKILSLVVLGILYSTIYPFPFLGDSHCYVTVWWRQETATIWFTIRVWSK